MLEFVQGDFFEFDAEIRVNTVNCVGVMGAGVALAFKKKYPQMFEQYVDLCAQKKLEPGSPVVWENHDIFSEKVEIINFPTKKHWRNPSKYEYIEDGLTWLASYLQSKSGQTITLPALGCGHGGLDWGKVKKLIENYLSESPARILVFEPSSSKKAGNSVVHSSDLDSRLSEAGIEIIDQHSISYPQRLKKFTHRKLFTYNKQSHMEFDIALVCGSKLNIQQKAIITEFIEFCISTRTSILLGGSAFERKLAIKYSKKLVIGCFLPTGIYSSAVKLNEINREHEITLLSLGDPFESFNKKEYLPSVLSGIYLAKKTLFITDRLSWLAKQAPDIKKSNIRSFFVRYDNLNIDDLEATKSIGSQDIVPPITSNDTFRQILL